MENGRGTTPCLRIDSQSRVSLAKHVATRQHTLAAAALLTALGTALERLEDAREEGRVVLHLGHHPAEGRVLVGVPARRLLGQ